MVATMPSAKSTVPYIDQRRIFFRSTFTGTTNIVAILCDADGETGEQPWWRGPQARARSRPPGSFQHQHLYPATDKTKAPDSPENVQWLTIAETKAKGSCGMKHGHVGRGSSAG